MIGWPTTEHQEEWAREFLKSKGVYTHPGAHYLFWLSHGVPVWVVAYDNWNGRTCQLHVASSQPRLPPRTFIKIVFRYAFVSLRMKMLFALVDSKNNSAIRLDTWLGFKETVRYTEVGETLGDLVVLNMTPEECRWLEKDDHGKERTVAA